MWSMHERGAVMSPVKTSHQEHSLGGNGRGCRITDQKAARQSQYTAMHSTVLTRRSGQTPKTVSRLTLVSISDSACIVSSSTTSSFSDSRPFPSAPSPCSSAGCDGSCHLSNVRLVAAAWPHRGAASSPPGAFGPETIALACCASTTWRRRRTRRRRWC